MPTDSLEFFNDWSFEFATAKPRALLFFCALLLTLALLRSATRLRGERSPVRRRTLIALRGTSSLLAFFLLLEPS